MSEPEDQKINYSKTSYAPSGGSATVLEHPVANENGGVQCADRGRYVDGQQTENGSALADSLWNRQGGQQEVCQASATENAHSECPVVSKLCQEPETGAVEEDGSVAHGIGEDGPSESNQVQGKSGKDDKRINVGPSGGRAQGLPDARVGKKKHRRRPSKKKRRWKPYFKLSWEEKKELDERETARASRVRAEMFAKGLPVAPYNTTQFLMEEHDREEPDLNTELAGRRFLGASRSEDTVSDEDYFELEDDEEDGSGGGGSDGIGRPGNAGGEFLQRDFSETYEKYHVESLQNMTKQELVREYLELEKCMSRLEEENNRLRCAGKSADGGAETPGALPDQSRLKELESELEKLRAQNSELRLQNQQWKEKVHAE